MSRSTGIRLVATLIALALQACASGASTLTAPVTEVSLGEAGDSIALRPGTTVVVVGGLRLTFDRVVSDSRCPRDVVCIWSGDAIVEIVADPICYPACGVPSLLLTLHTDTEPRAGQYLGYVVRLVALQPMPVSTGQIDPSDYVAWVRVTRVQGP